MLGHPVWQRRDGVLHRGIVTAEYYDGNLTVAWDSGGTSEVWIHEITTKEGELCLIN